jgi:hypothetical protein
MGPSQNFGFEESSRDDDQPEDDCEWRKHRFCKPVAIVEVSSQPNRSDSPPDHYQPCNCRHAANHRPFWIVVEHHILTFAPHYFTLRKEPSTAHCDPNHRLTRLPPSAWPRGSYARRLLLRPAPASLTARPIPPPASRRNPSPPAWRPLTPSITASSPACTTSASNSPAD